MKENDKMTVYMINSNITSGMDIVLKTSIGVENGAFTFYWNERHSIKLTVAKNIQY